LHALVTDGDAIDQQSALVSIAERMHTLDRILDAIVVVIKQQRNTNKLLAKRG